MVNAVDANKTKTDNDTTITGFEQAEYPYKTRLARRTCMRHVLSQLDYPDNNHDVATPPDPRIFHQAEAVIHNSDHVLASFLHPKSRKAK